MPNDKLLDKMRSLISGTNIGKEYKELKRYYKLNWALNPEFDYSYPISLDKRHVNDNNREYRETGGMSKSGSMGDDNDDNDDNDDDDDNVYFNENKKDEL